MQNSSVDIQSITDMLGNVSKFSISVQTIAKRLSQTNPENLGPIISYLGHMLALPPQNKKVQTSILALRLIKQTLLLGTYSFQILFCTYIVPILHDFLYKDPKQFTKFENLNEYMSRERCKELLKQKWYVQSRLNNPNTMRIVNGQVLTQNEINSCNNYLELIYQVIRWCSLIVQKHPSSVSTFRVSDNLDKLNFSSIFRVIARENNGIFKIYPPPPKFPQFKFFKYQSKQKFSKSMFSDSQKFFDKIRNYCENLTHQYIENKSLRALKKLHQLIYFTADSFIISVIVDTIHMKIQEQQKNNKVPTFKDTQFNIIAQYLNRASEIGRIKAYFPQAIGYSGINQNQYDFDQIQFQVKLAYKVLPLYLYEIFQRPNPSPLYYKALNKLIKSTDNLERQLEDNSLYLKQIYEQLYSGFSKICQITDTQIYDKQSKYQTKININNGQLNILPITNSQKLKNLTALYSQSLSQVLESIQNYSKNIKTKTKQVIKKVPAKNLKLLQKYGGLDMNNSQSLFTSNQNDNNSIKIQQDVPPNRHMIDSSLMSNNSSFGGASLSSKAKKRIQLKRMATFQKDKYNLINSQQQNLSSMTQPHNHSFKGIVKQQAYKESAYYTNQFQKQQNPYKFTDTIRSNHSVQSSLTDRINKRKAEIKFMKSLGKQRKTSNEFGRISINAPIVVINDENQSSDKVTENCKDKNLFVSFSKQNLQQRKFLMKDKIACQDQKQQNHIVPQTYKFQNIQNIESKYKSPPKLNYGLQKQSIKIIQFDQMQKQGSNTDKWHSNSKQKARKKIQKKMNQKRNKIQEETVKIAVQPTLTKPPFGFRKQTTKNQIKQQSEFISLSNQSSQFLDPSQDSIQISLVKPGNLKNQQPQTFAQILSVNPNSNKVGNQVKVIKTNKITGYMIPATSYKSKQKKLLHQMEVYEQYNNLYDQKINEKQDQIRKMQQKLEKQKDQLQAYAKHLDRAYETAYQNPDSLMIMSKDSGSGPLFASNKVKNLKSMSIQFINLKKKLFKQILYGKALLVENEYIQVGFNNLDKQCELTLFVQFKVGFTSFWINIQNIQQAGYTLIQQDKSIEVKNVPIGKRIKLKYYFGYKGIQNLQFMKLILKGKQYKNTQQIKWSCFLPFCLYRNYFSIMKNNSKNFIAKFVTQWQPCNEELRQNRKQFISHLFKNGKWVQQNQYELAILFKGDNLKMRILFSGKNFAIQAQSNHYLDLINNIGSLLSKNL